jgi:hypothetical protein
VDAFNVDAVTGRFLLFPGADDAAGVFGAEFSGTGDFPGECKIEIGGGSDEGE